MHNERGELLFFTLISIYKWLELHFIPNKNQRTEDIIHNTITSVSNCGICM